MIKYPKISNSDFYHCYFPFSFSPKFLILLLFISYFKISSFFLFNALIRRENPVSLTPVENRHFLSRTDCENEDAGNARFSTSENESQGFLSDKCIK